MTDRIEHYSKSKFKDGQEVRLRNDPFMTDPDKVYIVIAVLASHKDNFLYQLKSKLDGTPYSHWYGESELA